MDTSVRQLEIGNVGGAVNPFNGEGIAYAEEAPGLSGGGA